uniref:Uncharacterized protein n=1 Tax=Cacopsylla melanoneura TaxID=428564 RepID=A0A8D8ZBH9_9HEMI
MICFSSSAFSFSKFAFNGSYKLKHTRYMNWISGATFMFIIDTSPILSSMYARSSLFIKSKVSRTTFGFLFFTRLSWANLMIPFISSILFSKCVFKKSELSCSVNTDISSNV